MYPIESYTDAVLWLQGFIDEAKEQGVEPPLPWFMARWEGEDAEQLCGVNFPIYELVGFLGGFGMDNVYVTSDVAERLSKEFDIGFLSNE